MQPLLTAAGFDFGIQWVLWAFASAFRTEKFYDLAGSATYIFLAWQTLLSSGKFNFRQLVQTGCVTAWGLRLGSFLFARVLRDGRDSRFDKVRDNPKVFFIYWSIQGVWVFITLLPTLLLNTKREDPELGWKDYLGWGLWSAGFLLEALADHQKSVFKANPSSKGKWISTGVWSLCRHPNYLGEIVLWTGLFMSASSVMKGVEYGSVISPIFVTFLLTKVSGIPIQDRQALKRWGDVAAYQEYRRKTAMLIPYIW
ncbi:predicted protein [Nematostella vectensis]|uniref:Steroid 5-alpha reductase C-terminal domain-containing protein n=2 Tax=Nematostella vectensis TaxID=45351 RepID=A7RVP1_NEMVE|nr:predicted protein [Nematostella vectensis]|eukprot:XP_001636547.1 predicted protein [Nematostella vectensis]